MSHSDSTPPVNTTTDSAQDRTTAVPQPTLPAPEPDECEVLLIRHGRSADVVPGSPDSVDPPLHVIGVRQAQLLAERLAGKTLHAVYSSQLARALQTAAPLAAARGLQTVVFRDLEEVRLGAWGNGEFRRRAAVRDPEWVAWSRTGRWDGIPGAEGDDAFRARVSGVIDALAARHPGQSIAVVAHGGSINAYLAHLLGIHRSMVLTVENTSVTKMRVGPHGPTIVTANDCHHLYDPVLAST
ncbi:MAG: histidine phosphatase family protein [Actinomycetota bacterium]|nr:histidine phosphatase family protein [Actinomycetota bacterium]